MSEYRLPTNRSADDSMFAVHRASTSLCLMTDGRGRGVVVIGRGPMRGGDGTLIVGEPSDFEPLPVGTVIEVTA